MREEYQLDRMEAQYCVKGKGGCYEAVSLVLDD